MNIELKLDHETAEKLKEELKKKVPYIEETWHRSILFGHAVMTTATVSVFIEDLTPLELSTIANMLINISRC